MGLTRGAITGLADRSIAKAPVLRAASAEDGRAQTLAPTERDLALVPDLAALADRNAAEVFDGLTEDERATLAGLLRRAAG